MAELIEKMREAIYNSPVGKEISINQAHPISEVCSQVATEHFANQWIKVEDKLPDNNTNVIVWSGNFYDAHYHKGNFLYRGGNIMDDVTHWMIPEPPKQ